jgi:glycosyltransferase involved in cell wall biosynthesis
LQGEQLARELNRYRIMVIPSRVLEGFGVVALEGIASGCVVVGADAGGLPEAIGPAGRVFPMGDARALASDIRHLIREPATVENHRLAAKDHLARHNQRKIASAYAAICHRARLNAGGR